MIHIKSFAAVSRALRGQGSESLERCLMLDYKTAEGRVVRGPCELDRLLPDNLKEYHETN